MIVSNPIYRHSEGFEDVSPPNILDCIYKHEVNVLLRGVRNQRTI